MVPIPESTASESSPPSDLTDSSNATSSIQTRPLTARQERNLVEYIEELFLDVMRNYKKRSHPSSTLPTLQSYLRATHTLLSLILQIPPVKQQQAALRTALLLRFSSECLSAIPNYPPPALLPPTIPANEDQSGVETLRQLLNWLDELDKGWNAVLSAQFWDATAREGVDVDLQIGDEPPHSGTQVTAAAANTHSQSDMEIDEDYPPITLIPTTIVSQTDRARLRSLLLAGSAALEEWLDSKQSRPSTATAFANGHGVGETEAVIPDLESTLDHLGLQQLFNDLFSRTLGAMGELGGEVLNVGDELEME